MRMLMIALVIVIAMALYILDLPFLSELKEYFRQKSRSNVAEQLNSEVSWQTAAVSLENRISGEHLSEMHVAILGHWRRDDGVDVYFSDTSMAKRNFKGELIAHAYAVHESNSAENRLVVSVTDNPASAPYEMVFDFFDNRKQMRSQKSTEPKMHLGQNGDLLDSYQIENQIEYSNYTYTYIDDRMTPI